MKRSTKRFAQDFSGESKTDRSFAAGCNVNNIVRHYQQTGIDPAEDRKALARFGSASSQSYEDAMRLVADIDSAFHELPSKTRAEHANDPQQWIEYLGSLGTPPDEIVDSGANEGVSGTTENSSQNGAEMAPKTPVPEPESGTD